MGTTTTLFPMLESMSVLNFEAGELWVKIGTASKSGVSLARYLALCFSRVKVSLAWYLALCFWRVGRYLNRSPHWGQPYNVTLSCFLR